MVVGAAGSARSRRRRPDDSRGRSGGDRHRRDAGGIRVPAAATDIWLPLRLSRAQPPSAAIKLEQYRQYRILSVVGRLAPAASLARTRAELAALSTPRAREPGDESSQTATAVALHDAIVGDVRLRCC